MVLTHPVVLVATWREGVHVISDRGSARELDTHSIRGMTRDGRGGALAIVDGRSLCRRSPGGTWSTVAVTTTDLACCVVAGRDAWYAGSAIVDGQRVGPPLGIRSITATADGAVLLANVHVGGIPRSTDGGLTWRPTIDIHCDVHEVRAHPTRPEIVMAASAAGLCASRDGGETWAIEGDGLHAAYCSAIAFVGDDILVSSSDNHFAAEGAIYRRRVDDHVALAPVGAGLPVRTAGIVDTGCIDARGASAALADQQGHVYAIAEGRSRWSRLASGLPSPSGVLVI